jgi:hypothetical protein
MYLLKSNSYSKQWGFFSPQTVVIFQQSLTVANILHFSFKGVLEYPRTRVPSFYALNQGGMFRCDTMSVLRVWVHILNFHINNAHPPLFSVLQTHF